jgi:hypothetical protein
MAADKNEYQNAGDYTLDGVLIVGSSGEKINVISQVRELNIYQSIDSPYMSGNVVIADAEGVAEILPFLGQERLLFLLQTPSHEGTVDFNEYHAIIYNVETRFHTSDRKQTLVLNWTSLEHYKNIRTKVSASFDGMISDIVEKILTDSDYLETSKPIHIELTKNIRKYVIPNLNPFQTIELLRKEAVSAEEQSPHFLFFENPDGFHFRTLDSLIGSQGSLSVDHKRTYTFEPPQENEPPAQTAATILHWEAEDNTNNFLSTKLGMFGSTLYYHDIFNKNIQRFEFNYTKDSFAIRNSTNQEDRSSGTVVSQGKIDKEKTITEFPDSKIFVHPTASDKLHSLGTDNNADEWLQESISRELEREYFTLKIETYGNTDVMAGDMINVSIPSNKPLSVSSGKDAVDPILSGRYLVTSLHHKVTPTDQNHTMTMTIMKDSVSIATPVREVQYPEEPKGSVDVGLKKTKRKLKPKTKGTKLTADQRNYFSS